MRERFICPEGISGRADKILASHYVGFSRAFIKQSIEEKKITLVDGSGIEPKTKISSGEELLVFLVRPQTGKLKPYKFDLNVLYEDEHILVLNKKAGMVVHPGDGTNNETLVHALLHHCEENLSPIGAPLRPGIVHRLDKDTSGAMVVAKTESAHLSLVEQFSNRETGKHYLAIACRKLEGAGEFTEPNSRHPTVRVKMAISEKGKAAKTKWIALQNFGELFTKVKCEIMTGRTHQIRVHFSAAGHPLAGDKTYGYKGPIGEDSFPRVMLHSSKLSIKHPFSHEVMNFEAPLPVDFQECLKKLQG